MTAPHAGRGVAIGAGSLAVLLGALDTYVVVTIMRDIIGTIGIPINHLQRITPIITWYLLGHRRDATAGPGIRPIRPQTAAASQPGHIPDRVGDHGAVHRSGCAGGGPHHPGRGQRRTAAGDARAGCRPRPSATASGVLGGIGAAQELGSVLGPLYGILIVWLTSRWQDVFWINVPLALAAMVMIHFSLPSRERDAEPEKIDLIGGLLLAITLGLAVIGLYNANPDGKHALPSYGPPLIVAAVVAAVVFGVWERFSRNQADRTY